MKHWLLAAPALALSMGTGCKNDQGLTEIKVEDVAVTTGDFDELEEALTRNGVPNTPFEGYIAQAVYDEEADPDAMTLKVETLFTGKDDKGAPELWAFDAAFVNSGTRGLGAWVYNGVSEDDTLLSEPELAETIAGFLARNRTLVVTDWAYDLVEETYPDPIRFLNEGEGYDAAQVGTSDTVVAEVTNADLAEALGSDQLEVVFDFSYWAVMVEASASADVYLRGDVSYRASGGEGEERLEDVPLLVGFDVGSGRVVYSSFSWRAQKDAVADVLLRSLIEGIEAEDDGAEDDDNGE